MTINILRGVFFRTTSKLLPAVPITPVGDISQVFTGASWQSEITPNISPNNTAVAQANGTAMTIYTVTATKAPVLYGFDVFCAAAGNFALRYNGSVIFNFRGAANSVRSLALPKGLFLSGVAGVFDLFNNTGAASDMSAALVIAEYVP